MRFLTSLAAAALAATVACDRTPAHAGNPPRAVAPAHAPADAGAPDASPAAPRLAPAAKDAAPAAKDAAPAPAKVTRLRVPGDRPASVVRAGSQAPRTVFLPGVCSNAFAYLAAFPEAARRQGGVVGIDGDRPCKGAPGFYTFSWDASRVHSRIEAALAAAGLDAVPAEGITILGYSQGASLAERLVARFPRRYARVVLIGAPSDPSPRHLKEARGVVTMACSRDVTARMRRAAEQLARAGVPATYLEMPGCTHGNVADAERTFGAAFDFLRTRARAPSGRTAAVPITGEIAPP